MTKPKTKPPRRTVEVYFILYLAALIFLLPNSSDSDTKNNTKSIIAMAQHFFILQPDKAQLICQILNTDSSNNVMAVDSLNIIRYTGEVRDVKIDVMLEDKTLGRTVMLTAGEPIANVFSVRHDSDEQAVHFSWNPSVDDLRNHQYVVKIKATGSPDLRRLAASGVDTTGIVTSGILLSAETQFALNVINVDRNSLSALAYNTLPGAQQQQGDGIGGITAQEIIQRQLLEQQQQFAFYKNYSAAVTPMGEFSLRSDQDQIRTVANQEWTARLLVNNADATRDLHKPSVLVIRSSSTAGGIAEVGSVSKDEIIIKGVAPSSGSMRVLVTAERIVDKQEFQISLLVVPQTLAQAVVPTSMYPGLSYRFKGNLPFLSGTQESRVVLYDGSTEVAQSTLAQGAGEFDFMPTNDDTGKVFRFERIINGVRIGQAVMIRVNAYPPPEIRDHRYEGSKIIVFTKSAGTVSGQENLVTLEVVAGRPGKIRSKPGNYQKDYATNSHYQVFEIDGASGPFSIRAVDKRNRYSAPRQIEP